MTSITLKNPLEVTLSKRLFWSNGYGVIFTKEKTVNNHKNLLIYKFPKNEIVYECRSIISYKEKGCYLAILTLRHIVYIDLHTFNERIFTLNSLNVVDFDFIYDEVTKKATVVTVSCIDGKSTVQYISPNSDTIRIDNISNTCTNVHIVDNTYIADYYTPMDTPLKEACPYSYKNESIQKVIFLPCANKWFVQYFSFFVIINKQGCALLLQKGIDTLLNTINEYDIDCMLYNIGHCKTIVFDKHESVVIYEYENSIYVADTMYPYHICCTEKLKRERFCTTRVLDIMLNENDYTLYVLTSNNRVYMFSMFPISLTASTRIATTFE